MQTQISLGLEPVLSPLCHLVKGWEPMLHYLLSQGPPPIIMGPGDWACPERKEGFQTLDLEPVPGWRVKHTDANIQWVWGGAWESFV